MVRTQGFLFAALLFGAAGFYQPMDYDNTKSRYMLLSAVVDEGRFSIDSNQEYTIDKAIVNGHYYSIKPIGLPLLSVPVYWFLGHAVLGPDVPGGVSHLMDPEAKYLVRAVTVSLPFALLGLILFQFLLSFGVPARNALWACFAYAFGTIALNHATIYSGHETAAFFIFSSFSILFQMSRAGASAGGRSTALGLLAGLCAGCAVLCDYMVAIYAVIIAVYAVSSTTSRASKISFAGGALLCAVALALYDQACFGSPWSTGYSHLAFEPFREYTSKGLLGIQWPDPRVMVALLGSVSRGLFFVSPVLLFALAGLVFLYRRAHSRREFWVMALIPAAALLIYSGYPGWHGGWTFGPRYLVPALPFLVLPMALAVEGSLWFLLLGLSVFQVACAQLGWPHAAPEIRNPIAEFILPLMRVGGSSLSLLGGGRPGAIAGGIMQYVVAAVLAGLAFQGLPRPIRRRLPGRWRLGMGVWAAYVLLALSVVRSPDIVMVHRCRWQVLNDTAQALRSPLLQKGAALESLSIR
jgi:hypothetical protein